MTNPFPQPIHSPFYPPRAADGNAEAARCAIAVRTVADERSLALLRAAFDEIHDLACRVSPRVWMMGRVKSLSSTLAKMTRLRRGLSELHDVFGVRAVFDTTSECYRLSDSIHSQFTVLQQGFRDYIATPKPNGYQSLHLVVEQPHGIRVEVQIRTAWMHELCTHGSASHTIYKQLQAHEMWRSRLYDPRGALLPSSL